MKIFLMDFNFPAATGLLQKAGPYRAFQMSLDSYCRTITFFNLNISETENQSGSVVKIK